MQTEEERVILEDKKINDDKRYQELLLIQCKYQKKVSNLKDNLFQLNKLKEEQVNILLFDLYILEKDHRN